ncbi:Ribonuclease [Spironucleus salmonicida]|uniref:Ribonuclease n=1 Tax=Spironucleus salmonicida TaxID=348837 RepID=V6LHE1_9EUKA|nr:Ribonuclease [Spironucleus salmonicida]|eukprot:EST43703.1 Ribonuclease HII [Spironucleus salmonicida]
MKYVVGIDEAGRGPVLGPMVYGIAAYPEYIHYELKKLGADDSKKLTHQDREKIIIKLKSQPDFYCNTISISARDISEKMLNPNKISLNVLAFTAARDLLIEFSQKFEISHAYIDLISPASQYEQFIQQKLPDLQMTIQAKADAIYPITGAASIVAKLTRDDQIQKQWGSGYPGDEKTITWLRNDQDMLYGFSENVRISWKTCDTLIQEKCKKCVFFGDESLKTQLVNNKYSVYI